MTTSLVRQNSGTAATMWCISRDVIEQTLSDPTKAVQPCRWRKSALDPLRSFDVARPLGSFQGITVGQSEVPHSIDQHGGLLNARHAYAIKRHAVNTSQRH